MKEPREYEIRLKAIRIYEETGRFCRTLKAVNRSRGWLAKWAKRYKAFGLDGLRDQSRIPKHVPSKTPRPVIRKILALRDELAALMGRQFISDFEDFADNRIGRLVRDVERGSTSIEEASLPGFPVAAQPFREPGIAPLDSPLDDREADSVFIKSNRFYTEDMFVADVHPLRLLPMRMGRSLSDGAIASRYPYGFSHLDVLMEIRYQLLNRYGYYEK
jgi:hypothetical protein